MTYLTLKTVPGVTPIHTSSAMNTNNTALQATLNGIYQTVGTCKAYA